MGGGAPRLRVLIADDSAVTRFAIRTALENAGLVVCAEAGDARAAAELALSERPDVCVLDVMMPEGGGIRAVRDISRSLPEATILMLSASRAGEDVMDAMREGASGYVLKGGDLDQLAEAVRAAGAGERPMSRRAVGNLMEEARLRDRQAALADGRGASLTDHEWELLELLAGDRSEHDVALRLGIDESTIAGDVEEAARKLGVADRDAALELVRSLRSRR